LESVSLLGYEGSETAEDDGGVLADITVMGMKTLLFSSLKPLPSFRVLFASMIVIK